MYVVSNAHLSEAEIIQLDRWDQGPLELVFLDTERRKPSGWADLDLAILEWNRSFRGGFARPSEATDRLTKEVPALEASANPNVFIVPRVSGYSELHQMLASVVPKSILSRYGLEKRKANFWLWPIPPDRVPTQPATAYIQAFEDYIWERLARAQRVKKSFFAPDSSLRLLAGDHRFWMNRLFRVAIECADSYEEAHDDDWRPLEVIEAELRDLLQPEERGKYVVRRPLKGGWLWDADDQEDCDAVVDEMLDGVGVMDSLEPVLDVLHSHRTHEDFSAQYSWVKEDFERAFYSKRSKVKVSLVETVDDFPAWAASEPEGYANVLFRDILCAFNARERHIILALRQGKTVTEISRDLGHNGHAAVSRRVKEIKAKIRPLLA